MVTHLHFYRLVEGDLVVTFPGLNSIVEPNFLFVLVLPILDLWLLVLHDLPWFQLWACIVEFDVRTECKVSFSHISSRKNDPLINFYNLSSSLD